MNNKTWLLLILVLALVANAYDRATYGKGWPALKNKCTVRTYTLVKHSRIPVTCTNLANGLWIDPYTGDSTRIANKMDVDHVVPLEEVELSGGATWPDTRKHAYYSDTTSEFLLPVSVHENRSKGGSSVTSYLPPRKAYRAHYCLIWYAIKRKYKLSVTTAEIVVLRRYLGSAYKNDLPIRK